MFDLDPKIQLGLSVIVLLAVLAGMFWMSPSSDAQPAAAPVSAAP